jgi:ABC-type protease/lipase transport system fused ATPase/permease subunit
LIVVTHKAALLNLVDRIIILTEKGIAADDKKEVVLEMLKNKKAHQAKQS